MLLNTSTVARADTGPSAYLGADLGISDYSLSMGQCGAYVGQQLQSQSGGLAISGNQCFDGSTDNVGGGGAHIGLRFSPALSAELGRDDLGVATLPIKATAGGIFTYKGNTLKLHSMATVARLVLSLPLGNRGAALSALLGLYSADTTATDGYGIDQSGSSSGPVFGLRLSQPLQPRLTGLIQAQQLQQVGDNQSVPRMNIRVISVGMSYQLN